MMVILALLLGLLGAAIFLIICRVVTPETQTQTLAVGLMVAAFIYIGFAILGQASAAWISVEVAGIAIYGLFAVLGLYSSRWWLMVGWLLHPVWDLGLHFYERSASFAPAWYVLMCLSFDLAGRSVHRWNAVWIIQIKDS
ncbi:MAG: DUF6010 family protein [Thainema sp.]